MTTEQKRFTVINNTEFNTEKKEEKTYHTNPLTEKLMKFTNNEAGPKFSVQDLLKW